MSDRGTPREPVTVIVLAADEEQVLPRCLGELAWADEVLVVDSGSTDRTREVAEAHGARVVDQPWLGWPRQRNAGAALARHDWVFFLEADEVPSATLRRSVEQVLAADPDPRDAWAVDRRDEFMGQLLPPAQRASKTLAKVRLYHRGTSRWDETMLVHEEVLVTGTRRLLDGILLHWRVQDLPQQAERIARYSGVEAAALGPRAGRTAVLRMVGLPVARFVWLYAVKGYAARGVPGLVNSVMRAHADFLRWAGHLERARGATPVDPPRHLVDR